MILCILVRLFWSQLQQAITASNVTISSPPEMSPMLTTKVNSDKTTTHTSSGLCAEGNGAGGQASNGGKPTIGAVVNPRVQATI